jgi:ribonuclease P protein component
MLSQANRLHQDKEIKRLVQKGKTFFLPQFVIKYQVLAEPVVKIGFVVSTKVDKRAVVRNRLKRQLREVMRSLLPDLQNRQAILIITKKSALDLKFADLKKQLIFALTKIRIYHKK